MPTRGNNVPRRVKCDREQYPDVFCIPLARQPAGGPEADAPFFPAYGAIYESVIIVQRGRICQIEPISRCPRWEQTGIYYVGR